MSHLGLDEGIDGSPNLEENDHSLQEEEVMARLFCEVLHKLLKRFCHPDIIDDIIEESILDIIEKFTQHQYSKVDFSKFENLCGYFYRYSTLNAAIARDRFLDAIHHCPGLRDKINKSVINVISLGGGPGTDILGFCSSLWECVNENKTLYITVVDNVKRWASFYNMIECFVREGGYGNASTLYRLHDVCSTFMCVDIKNPSPPRKYSQDLKNADIVILSRVLDGLNWSEDPPESILRNIVPRMQKDALLLLIDSCIAGSDVVGLEKIYDSNLQEFHLSVRQEMKFGCDHCTKSKAEIAVYKKT